MAGDAEKDCHSKFDSTVSIGEIVPWRFANIYSDPRILPYREIPDICGTSITIQQYPTAEITVNINTGMILWDAAYVLAR